jgi:hypothetical protein
MVLATDLAGAGLDGFAAAFGFGDATAVFGFGGAVRARATFFGVVFLGAVFFATVFFGATFRLAFLETVFFAGLFFAAAFFFADAERFGAFLPFAFAFAFAFTLAFAIACFPRRSALCPRRGERRSPLQAHVYCAARISVTVLE